MKKLLFSAPFILAASFLYAQPCKVVKKGMTKAEVLKLVGAPTEIDTLGTDLNGDGSRSLMEVWQYGEVRKDGNQRVQFTGGMVDSDVIADGTKHDELMQAFMHGDIPKEEIEERLKKLNREACK